MKSKQYGPSLYYATDKNIFDALNQHKVNTPTILKLFQRRNILVSKKTPREDLAMYFARLNHDYYDHRDISSRLGVAPRRERITSMDIKGEVEVEHLQVAVDQLKKELEEAGDIVQVSRANGSIILNLQYSTIDYKKSEFNQVQVRDGTIEFTKEDDGFLVRNTQNEYLDNVRDSLIGKLESASGKQVSKVPVSLFDVTSPKLRSKFFHELATKLSGYAWRDVTDVYVYKAKPDVADDEEEEGQGAESTEAHVERVSLRGSGITRTELLNRLLEEKDYYITKIGWTAEDTLNTGNLYDIEAVFTNPKECTGFSFILARVYPVSETGSISVARSPKKEEIEEISKAVEVKARELVISLRSEFASGTGDDEDE